MRPRHLRSLLRDRPWPTAEIMTHRARASGHHHVAHGRRTDSGAGAAKTPAVIVRLAAGEDTALVDADAGGRLASLKIGDREVLLTEPRKDFVLPAATWGCFLMAPFAGRFSDGRLRYRGRTVELPRNFPPHAIHGAVFDVPWQVERAEKSAVSLACEMAPERWPFRGRVR